MIIKDGRFGAYVTDGEINATLRRGDDIASITSERAAELLAEKRAKGPAPKKKAAARKTSGAAKKTTSNGSGTTRRPAAKKAAARQR
jgi:DNA topoisomerase-1